MPPWSLLIADCRFEEAPGLSTPTIPEDKDHDENPSLNRQSAIGKVLLSN